MTQKRRYPWGAGIEYQIKGATYSPEYREWVERVARGMAEALIGRKEQLLVYWVDKLARGYQSRVLAVWDVSQELHRRAIRNEYGLKVSDLDDLRYRLAVRTYRQRLTQRRQKDGRYNGQHPEPPPLNNTTLEPL